jgi:hypothetical protein
MHLNHVFFEDEILKKESEGGGHESPLPLFLKRQTEFLLGWKLEKIVQETKVDL